MKIVNLATFLALPENTVYSKYAQHVCGPVEIKDETRAGTWWAVDTSSCVKCDNIDEFVAAHEKALSGQSVELDFETVTKDGLYEKDQLFAVWDKKDVDGLIAKLQLCSAVFV